MKATGFLVAFVFLDQAWGQRLRFPVGCSFLCADLSFISLKLVIPQVLASLTANAEAILLVKPPVRSRPRRSGRKGGIVRDPVIHDRVCREIWDFFTGTDLKRRSLAPAPPRAVRGIGGFSYG